MVQPGESAPEVVVANQNNQEVTLTYERPTVLYFYPEDFTSGCTIEANDFQDALQEFGQLGAEVYGVSMDSVTTHSEFAEQEGIEFDLLADTDGKVGEAFGLDIGEGYNHRRTFVLVDGRVSAAFDPELSDPSGHADEVVEYIRDELTGEK